MLSSSFGIPTTSLSRHSLFHSLVVSLFVRCVFCLGHDLINYRHSKPEISMHAYYIMRPEFLQCSFPYQKFSSTSLANMSPENCIALSAVHMSVLYAEILLKILTYAPQFKDTCLDSWFRLPIRRLTFHLCIFLSSLPCCLTCVKCRKTLSRCYRHLQNKTFVNTTVATHVQFEGIGSYTVPRK